MASDRMCEAKCHPWAWHEGPVPHEEEHFELAYWDSQKPDEWDREHPPLALVGMPTANVFPVRLFVEDLPAGEATTKALDAIRQELDFFLVEKGEQNPWAYMQYHCGTSANVYGSVHWRFCLGRQQPSR